MGQLPTCLAYRRPRGVLVATYHPGVGQCPQVQHDQAQGRLVVLLHKLPYQAAERLDHGALDRLLRGMGGQECPAFRGELRRGGPRANPAGTGRRGPRGRRGRREVPGVRSAGTRGWVLGAPDSRRSGAPSTHCGCEALTIPEERFLVVLRRRRLRRWGARRAVGCRGRREITHQEVKGQLLVGASEHGVNRARLQVCGQLKNRGDVGPQTPQPQGEAGDLLALGVGEPPRLPAAQLLLIEPQVVLLLRVEPDHPVHRGVVEDMRLGPGLAQRAKHVHRLVGHPVDRPRHRRKLGDRLPGRLGVRRCHRSSFRVGRHCAL